MSDDELAAMRDRADAATPGNYFIAPLFSMDVCSPKFVALPKDEQQAIIDAPDSWLVETEEKWVGDLEQRADAEFFDHARTDVPRLLDEIAELRAALELATSAREDAETALHAEIDNPGTFVSPRLMAMELRAETAEKEIAELRATIARVEDWPRFTERGHNTHEELLRGEGYNDALEDIRAALHPSAAQPQKEADDE